MTKSKLADAGYNLMANALAPSLADTLRDIADVLGEDEHLKQSRFYLIVERPHAAPEVFSNKKYGETDRALFQQAAVKALSNA